jgi:glycosyltransferase involved in cell wall biosynthesis
MKITLAVVTWNDETVIKRFMEHHRPHVDEIVWADDGSTDKTIEIAKQYADKSIINPKREYNCEYYRQRLADLSSNDWVMMLDSDQFIDFDIVDNLRAIAQAGEEHNIPHYNLALHTIAHLECPACPKKVSYQTKFTNRKTLRWSIFPHTGAFSRTIPELPIGPSIVPPIGNLWHIMKDKETTMAQHQREHIIRMRRWIDVCKNYLQIYSEDMYINDRERCRNVFKSLKIDIDKVAYSCSKDRDNLIWIENDDELWIHMKKLGIV